MIARQPERVYLHVPILVVGSDKTRGPFSEVTSTVNISRKGARIVLRSFPERRSQVGITNLTSHEVASFTVAYQGASLENGRTEFGVEINDSSVDFWGIKFEDRPERDESLIGGLLVCLDCEQRVFGYVTQTEYRNLGEDLNFRRFCDRCQTITSWAVGSSDESPYIPEPAPVVRAEPQQRTEPAHPLTGAERRVATRYALKVPLLVTGPSCVSERTVTEDLSQTGLLFCSRQKFEIGDLIQVVLGHGVADSPVPRACKVVRRVPIEESNRYSYGVMFQPAS